MRILILLALSALPALPQCGPAAIRKPIGNGQYSCVPKATVIQRTGTLTSGKVPAVDASGNLVDSPMSCTGGNCSIATTLLPRPLDSVRMALSNSQSTAIQVFGDSTSNEQTEWVYLLGQWVAAQYPAYTVKYRLWNTGTTLYDAAATIQTGTAGERYVQIGTQSATIPGSDIADVTGDVDIRVKVSTATWANGLAQVMFGHYGGAGARAFYFQVNSTGGLQWTWSSDGTNTVTKSTGCSPTGTDPIWLRVTHDLDDGAGNNVIRTWTSADGVTYAACGSTITTAGATTIFSDAALANTSWEIGARNSTIGPFSGKIYATQVMSAIDGTPVSTLPIDAWQPTGTSAFGGAPEFWILNGSYSGATMATITPNLAAMTPDYRQAAVLVSLSHNEASFGPTKMAAYGTFMTAVKGALKLAEPIILTQNPVISPGTTGVAQSRRRLSLLSWGPLNGYGVLDTYGAFLRDSRGLSALLAADGIHPNADGSALWRSVVSSALSGTL